MRMKMQIQYEVVVVVVRHSLRVEFCIALHFYLEMNLRFIPD